MPETDPALSPRCTHCGSDAVIPDVFVVAGANTIPAFNVGVYTRPDARVIKRPVLSEGGYRACGDCGFLMAFAAHPHTLWDAHIDRLANDLD
ncbi:hypothetical protein [Rubrivirga sp. IMCC45206]|uniref:hypothetical protein n=1 Tax=Rubrivirga sp. IMCC45206 TaxID=3391614 RepID=UPI0039901F68